MADEELQKKFITKYRFGKDRTKPGRLLETSRVGGVCVSRLFIDPGVVTGNYYHKETRCALFVEYGRVRVKFKQVNTGEEKEFDMEPGSGVVHVPEYVAIANKNIAFDPAVVILLTNRPLRSGDDYEYIILE